MISKKADERMSDNNIQNGIKNNFNAAKKYVGEQQANVGTAVQDHPYEFILGAFIGGVVLGTLFSKRRS